MSFILQIRFISHQNNGKIVSIFNSAYQFVKLFDLFETENFFFEILKKSVKTDNTDKHLLSHKIEKKNRKKNVFFFDKKKFSPLGSRTENRKMAKSVPKGDR